MGAEADSRRQYAKKGKDRDARRTSNRPRLVRCLLPPRRLDRSVLVLDLNRSHLSVELEEDVSEPGLDVDGTRGDELDDERLALVDNDVDLFSDRGLGEEVAGRKGAVERRSVKC
jgi:hypothetical protein